MTIRKATPDDIPAIRAMLQALADHEGAGYQVASESALLLHGFGANPLFHVLLAVTDDPYGMVIYYPDFSTHRGEPGVYVQDIFVVPAARGMGFAERLLAEVMKHQTWGACYMTLGVNPRNAIANRLYGRLGFRSRGYDFLILDGNPLAALA